MTLNEKIGNISIISSYFTYKGVVLKNTVKNRVEVKVPYIKPLCEKFKKIEKRSFDGITGVWSFPLDEYNNVCAIIEQECDELRTVKEFEEKPKTARFVAKI